MSAKITQLKTNKSAEKERMLAYIDFLREQVTQEKVENVIFVVEDSDSIQTEVIGDCSPCEAIGMVATANLILQMSLFE